MTQKKHLPSVDQLLLQLPHLIEVHGRTLVLAVIRAELAAAREGMRCGLPLPAMDDLHLAVQQRLEQLDRNNLRPVFNLTGTVLHTNLGRAPLAEEAITLMVAAARGPCALEYDLDTGARGDRDDLVSSLLAELVADGNPEISATIVNNNAAAVLLTLNALAQRREAIVSRGELVEIGGAFRIPDVMRRAQVKLVEVGTTNRTHPSDYQEAIHAKTALLMKVHTSNYAVTGFTASVPEAELARIAQAAGLPFIVDLGSGTLADFKALGLPSEPTPQQALAAGADLVTFSGDKLLGGPQAGLIVGRKHLIDRIKKNPLKRALRVGKTTLAALEATLRLYRDPDRLTQRLPTLRLLTRPLHDIQSTGETLLLLLQPRFAGLAEVSLQHCNSQIGSGSLPVERLDSVALTFSPLGKKQGKVLQTIETAFRKLPVPVIGYTRNAAYHLDLRCLELKELALFTGQLEKLDLPKAIS